MKLLIIEDDPNLAQNIKADFTDNGYTVEVAFDGLIAEKLLKKNIYDCVIMDINLPYKNGYELCTSFRKLDKKTPVIMLTAFAEIEDKINGFDCGADDYLTKPFYFKELNARVKALIKRSNNPIVEKNVSLLVFQDLVIDAERKVVKRKDQTIDLTAREYQILLTLAHANGNSVSKQELLKAIWGTTFEGNTNTIEVFINFLRNKIDKNHDRKLIRTRVGYGYYIATEPDEPEK